MIYFISALIGYLFGCVNMAKIISKSKGFDIKQIGTGNAGASNVFISVGKKYGVLVGVLDILKAFLATEIVTLIFPDVVNAPFLAGVMAVFGHIFPFWMKFKGGKGLAAFMGFMLALDSKYFFWLGLVLVIVLLVTDYIALSTISVSIIALLYFIFIDGDTFRILLLTLLVLVMLFKHIDNIKRIKNKTEVGFLRKNK